MYTQVFHLPIWGDDIGTGVCNNAHKCTGKTHPIPYFPADGQSQTALLGRNVSNLANRITLTCFSCYSMFSDYIFYPLTGTSPSRLKRWHWRRSFPWCTRKIRHVTSWLIMDGWWETTPSGTLQSLVRTAFFWTKYNTVDTSTVHLIEQGAGQK